jgi:hypothetical protein
VAVPGAGLTGGACKAESLNLNIHQGETSPQTPALSPARRLPQRSIIAIESRILVQKFIEMAEDSKPWHAVFPAPRTTAPIITPEEVLKDLSSDDLLLVDVRRTDFEGGTIKGSLNLPAHSFYMNRAILFDLCKRAGVERVAFYCGE